MLAACDPSIIIYPAAVSWVSVFDVEGQRYHAHLSYSSTALQKGKLLDLHVHLKLTTVCIKSHLHIWFQIHGIGATQMRIAEYTVQEEAPLTQQLKVCFVSVSTSPRTHLDLWIYKRRPTVCTSRGSLLLTPCIAQMSWFPNPATINDY